MTDRDDLTARAAAYAAGAMTPAERAAFERERRVDPELDAEAVGFVETAALLGLAVGPEEPPARLRDALLAAVGDAAADDDPAELRDADPADVAPLRRRPRLLSVVAAAAAIVLVAGSATAVGLSALRPASSQLGEVVAASDVQSASALVDGGGRATWVWSLDVGASLLIVSELPGLDADESYQLWYIDGGGPRSAGVFAPTAVSQTLLLEGAMTRGASVGMTVEPRGGSELPTSDPILVIPSVGPGSPA